MSSVEIIPAENILFGEFCVLMEQLQKKKRQNQEQNRILIEFFNDVKIKFASLTDEKNSTLFPLLRLLLPHRDRVRNPYNLKEKRLGEVLVKVLSLPKQSQDAQKLLNFRSVQNSANDSDFPGVSYFVLKNRVAQKSSKLTIGEINRILDKIAPGESGNKTTLDGALSYAFKNLTAEQLKWFLRIILKDMKLGMSEHRVLAAFHPDAPEFFDNCADLNKVCEEFAEGNNRPLELGIQLFYAVSPMLSERLNVTHISKLSPEKSYVIEDKFDGERFQMHMENGKFEYFSRKGHKYADHYGSSYESGLLTPRLKGCFTENVKSIILDGEMMGWNKEYQYFGSKGMAFDVKKITERSNFQPCFCVFDIMFYNGKSLVGPAEKGGLPLKERFKLLDSIFTDVQGAIYHSKRTPVKESVDILNALNAAIENQDEGIVVKDLDSYYIANKRNTGWYKIKPEYTDSTMTDLDLVVVGADEAENKRQGRAKSFYIACLDTASEGEGRWVCVGRVSSGVTHEERERVCRALEPHWHRASARRAPPCLRFPAHSPDLWLLPEHSLVLQVRATELIKSKEFASAYTLRFPRITKIRSDKPVKDIMTLQEFDQLASSKAAVVKLSSKRVNADQIGDSDIVVPRKQRSIIQVGEQFRTKALCDVQVTSQALHGRKVCVLSEDPDCSKDELIKIVQSHGGKHVQNIGADTWCAVAGKLTDKVKMILARADVDIMSTAWLRSLPQSQTLCDVSPLDMLSIKQSTRLSQSLQYDIYGDSYTKFTDEITLRKCFEKMEKNELPIYLMKKEMIQVDKILFDADNPYSFLRPCTIYYKGATKPLYIILAKMYGASISDVFTNVTHVIFKDTKTEDMAKVKKRNSSAFIVSEQWIEDCLAQKKLVPEKLYLITS